MSHPDPLHDPENVREEDSEFAPRKKSMAIKMTRPKFFKEHKNLLKVLKTGKGLKKEYKEQKAEVNKYK
jgi:hypothetical protein